MTTVITVACALVIFLALYEALRRRSGAPVRWGWVAAIVGCALAALLAGLIVH